jgi:ankyrin repeat protein
MNIMPRNIIRRAGHLQADSGFGRFCRYRGKGYSFYGDDMKRLFPVYLILLLAWSPLRAEDMSPLLLAAAAEGDVVLVERILAQGGDANVKNGAGRPALVMAAFNGNTHTLRALLAAGADVNAVDGVGASAVMEAAAFGHEEAVKTLIQAGADLNLKNKAGLTAVQRAEKGKHQEVLKLLQDAGAS